MTDKAEMAISELAVCPRIKTLYIYGAYNINSFDTIVKSCPGLDCLHLDDLGNYDTLGTIEYNSLRTLFISVRTNEPYVEPRLSKFLRKRRERPKIVSYQKISLEAHRWGRDLY